MSMKSGKPAIAYFHKDDGTPACIVPEVLSVPPKDK